MNVECEFNISTLKINAANNEITKESPHEKNLAQDTFCNSMLT